MTTPATIKIRYTNQDTLYAETESPELAAALIRALVPGAVDGLSVPPVRVTSSPELEPAPARGRRPRAATRSDLPELTTGPSGKRLGVTRAICVAFDKDPQYPLADLAAHCFPALEEQERNRKLRTYLSQLVNKDVLKRLPNVGDDAFGLQKAGRKNLAAEAE